MARHGFSDTAWEAAKADGKATLAECARARKMISYTDFMHQIRSISFETPHDSRLPQFLAEISTEEAKAGRGMMTALIVRKTGDQGQVWVFSNSPNALVTKYPIPRSFGSKK